MQTVYKNQSVEPPSHNPWQASLELDFAANINGTVLCKNLHHGPLMVQKPLYPESKQVCHVLLLHPPGGVVHGDQLSIKVNVQAHAHALITTPGAGKFYRSKGEFASLSQTIRLENQARLEWFPQESLLFDQSQVKLKSIIKLTQHARFIGWEMLCLGRKASTAPYQQGQFFQRLEVWRDDLPLVLERSHIQGGTALLESKWGMDNFPLSATFIATHCRQAELKMVQTLITQFADKQSFNCQISATLKQDTLICRFLGEQAEHARQVFIEIWKIIRPVVMERKVQVPRIWNT